MTTFIICQHCKKKLRSPIQVVDLVKNTVTGNMTNCPHCGQTTNDDCIFNED